jgi:hypothetical protein
MLGSSQDKAERRNSRVTRRVRSIDATEPRLLWLDSLAVAFIAVATVVLVSLLAPAFTFLFAWTGPAAPYIGAALAVAFTGGIVGCIAEGIRRGESGGSFRNMAAGCLQVGSAGLIGGGIAGPILYILGEPAASGLFEERALPARSAR